MVRKKSKSYVPSTYRFFSPVAILVFLFIIFLGLLQSIPLLNEYKTSKDFRDKQQSRVNELETEQEKLKQKKDFFENGASQDEAAIRERYRMVKPGEILIQLEIDE